LHSETSNNAWDNLKNTNMEFEKKLAKLKRMGSRANYALRQFRTEADNYLKKVLKEHDRVIDIEELNLPILGTVNSVSLMADGEVSFDGNMNLLGCVMIEDIANPMELVKILQAVNKAIEYKC
jgi:hypothetical protein